MTEQVIAQTLLALRHALWLLYGDVGTDAPFEVELKRLIALYESMPVVSRGVQL